LSMKWTIACCRPLAPREIAEALVVDCDDMPHFHPGYGIAQPIEILSICGGFMSLSTESRSDAPTVSEDLIELAHASVRDFLPSPARCEMSTALSFTEAEAHTCVAESCLVYLCSISLRVESRKRMEGEYYLASYAAQFWVEHSRLAHSKTTLDDKIMEQFDASHHYRLVN
jgi:hypothetical protein